MGGSLHEEAVGKLRSWMDGKMQPPDEVQIYPTNRCNLDCLFCYQRLKEYRLEDEVPAERWLSVGKELVGMGVRKILISGGGEPMARDVTIGLMELFKRSGVRGRMIHNGTLWTDDTIRRAVACGWDHITFSVDGLQQSHDHLRGRKGAFDTIVSNIRRFNDAKRRAGSHSPVMETSTVLTRTNFREMPEFIRLFHSLGIRHISFEPVCVNNPGVEELKMTLEDREEFFRDVVPPAEKIASELGVSTNLYKLKDVKVIEKTGGLDEEIMKRGSAPDPAGSSLPSHMKEFLASPCFEPWLWPKIEANGEVWPCSTVPLKENIKEKSFREIWFGPAFEAFRSNMMQKKLTDSCRNCVFTHLHTMDMMREELKKDAVSR